MNFPRHRAAMSLLTVACLLWGLSFPVSKALSELYLKMMPAESSWFVVGMQGALRFLAASLLMLPFTASTLRSVRADEFKQGLGLGLFGGLGIVFQVDGLNYTSASTSAFLTQAYCVILPVYHALRHLRFPPIRTGLATVFVLFGVAILAKFDLRTLTMGRGEWETLVSALFFTGQILQLERSNYCRNRSAIVSVIMFLTIGLIFALLALVSHQRSADFLTTIQSAPANFLLGLLVIFCTLGAFNLMNRWQRFVTSTEAGLIYTAEPLFASFFALMLPSWISSWTGLSYQNESFSFNLLIGGSLIVVANLVMQFRPLKTSLAAETPETKPSEV